MDETMRTPTSPHDLINASSASGRHAGPGRLADYGTVSAMKKSVESSLTKNYGMPAGVLGDGRDLSGAVSLTEGQLSSTPVEF